MNWLRQRVVKNPLAWLALAGAAGVLAADRTPASPWLWSAGALLGCLAVVIRPKAMLLAGACFMTFGFLHQSALSSSRDHPLRQLLKPGQRVSATLVGHFVRAPMVRDEGPANREARVRVSMVELPALHCRVAGTTDIRVWLNDAAFVPSGGEYELSGTLNLVQRPWNPGNYDAHAAALRQGVVADFSAVEIRARGERSFSLRLKMLEWAERSRLWIARQLALGLESQEMPRVLITTMALGTSEAGSADMEEPFRNSGTLHVFAVSGLHVGLMAVIGWWLLKFAGVRRSRAVMLLIPLVFGYAFITGWVPSAARAAFMSAVFLLAPLANRTSRLINSIGAAALVLFSGDTLQFFQPGFQLSFGVLGAIALGAGALSGPFKPLTELDPFLPPMLASWWDDRWVWFRKKVLGLVTTSLAAWVGSVPLMMVFFQSCTPIAIVANVVLVPLSSLSLYTAVLALLAASLNLSLVQHCLNQFNAVLANAMMVSATWFSAVPGGHFAIPENVFRERAPVSLHVLSMPIGEGAQMLASGPEHWLLDCGSAKHSRRATLPYLRYQGVSQIDGLVLSHADAEHISAAPLLMNRYGIENVFVGPNEPWRFDSRATAMWQVANAAKDQMRHLKAGERLTIGHATALVLYPEAGDLGDRADDRSLILRIDCGRMRILWCNDAGFATEKSLLERWPAEELRADVLIRNQHKADWSALTEFLIAVQPQVVVSSSSPLVVEERMPEHLRKWCDEQHRLLWDTSETGMVQIDGWHDRLHLATWLTGAQVTLQAR